MRAPVPMPAPVRVGRGFVSETDLFGGFDDDVWAPNAGAAPAEAIDAGRASASAADSSADSLASLALSMEEEPAPPRSKLTRRDSDYDASDDLDGDSVDAWGSVAARIQPIHAPMAADGTVRVADLVAATRRSAQALAATEEEEDYDSSRWHDTV